MRPSRGIQEPWGPNVMIAMHRAAREHSLALLLADIGELGGGIIPH